MVKKFTIPFASQGDANDIPDALQVDGKVSFTQGFSYDYERPYDDPQAKDIAREDMNGIFKAITSAVGELQTLGASEWSSAISYPKGAIVYHEKDLYISQVDDNQNEPPQNWVSITSIANDSLKKAANLSDLTNKATARNNLGLGSSATLNKTDVLGTSTSLVATQKLVNDTKINLESSKQDKLEFVGSGKVMREGAYSVGSKSIQLIGNISYETAGKNPDLKTGFYEALDCIGAFVSIQSEYGSLLIGGSAYNGTAPKYAYYNSTNGNKNLTESSVHTFYTTQNTTIDKSGFLRASGSANALTEADAIPVGTIQAYIGEAAPNDKWLLCRGQAFSAGSYPGLAQLLPNLKIPDLRGVALRGLDANRGFDPDRTLLSYQEDAIRNILGAISDNIGGSLMSSSGVFYSSLAGVSYDIGDGGRKTRTGDIFLDASRAVPTAHENRMKNVAVNFIIKAR